MDSTRTRQWTRDFHTDFTFEDPELDEHYDEIISDLVRTCPVARSKTNGGFLVISDYERVRKCILDWEGFSSFLDGTLLNPIADRPRIIPQELDPPTHTEWRHVINPHFTANKIAKFEPTIREVCRELVAQLPRDGRCDIVESFCGPMPGTVFFRTILPLPEDEVALGRKLTHGVMNGPPEERLVAYGAMLEYLGRYLENRRQSEPRGDIVDAILSAQIHGEPATPDDQLSCVVNILLGGVGTTSVVLAGGVHHFAEHPEDWEKALADPDAMDRAVEEVIRLYTPAMYMCRRATRDMEFEGHQLRRGDLVVLGPGAACRDPRVFEDPDSFHIDDDLSAHLSFSVGPHRCPGSHLARLMVKIAYEELLPQLTGLKLEGAPVYTNGPVRDCLSLPISFTPAPLPR
jgi:cytochrome P450